LNLRVVSFIEALREENDSGIRTPKHAAKSEIPGTVPGYACVFEIPGTVPGCFYGSKVLTYTESLWIEPRGYYQLKPFGLWFKLELLGRNQFRMIDVIKNC
jgi:hypothetical protein